MRPSPGIDLRLEALVIGGSALSRLGVITRQTRDFDIVLVDTAGRAIQADLERQVAMLRDAGALQMYLTLSLDSGARELAANPRVQAAYLGA